MTLLELCEPLFLKVCELNRMARLGQSQDYLEARSDLKGLFEELGQHAGSDAKLAAQLKKLELPLIFFVDSMIATSKLKYADQWHQNRLAKEKYNELAGDDRFFDLLEETLQDSSDDASDRLAVFYTCLGLGFVGACVGQPDQLKKYMSEIAPRIRHLVDVDRKSRLCPDAYKVDTRILTEPPGSPMVLVGIIFAFLVLSVLAVYYGLYIKATNGLDRAVTANLSQEKPR
jgi:type IV/VI secretion system ImpK/VasF family protein